MPKIRITVDGRLALTVEQAAERYKVAPVTVRGAIVRFGDAISAAAELDGHKKLYFAAELDAAMKARPGRGSNLRGHG